MWFRKYDLVLVAFVMSMFFFIIDTLKWVLRNDENKAKHFPRHGKLTVPSVVRRSSFFSCQGEIKNSFDVVKEIFFSLMLLTVDILVIAWHFISVAHN